LRIARTIHLPTQAGRATVPRTPPRLAGVATTIPISIARPIAPNRNDPTLAPGLQTRAGRRRIVFHCRRTIPPSVVWPEWYLRGWKPKCACPRSLRPVAARKYEGVVSRHGRVDTLTYYQLPVPKSLTQRKFWKGLRTIGVAIRISQQNGKETSDVRYYINSLRPGVRRFATAVRGHWGIENMLHWCLDVTFREDESRLRDRHAADNVAWLKRLEID
jgi:predicted transposase YbfD/YdcC